MNESQLVSLLGRDWYSFLKEDIDWDAFSKTYSKYELAAKSNKVFPQRENLFRAFLSCPVSNLKVVLLGQDPYHGEGQANGLCFSVSEGTSFPPSLKNIYKELSEDLEVDLPHSGDLISWSEQGVLLLNSCLSVEEAQPASHQDYGWQEFTDAVLSCISRRKENVVFILWGGFARKKKKQVDTKRHFVIESAHPSPLSSYRGFFGSKPFSKTNDFLKNKNIEPIHWQLG